MDKYVITITRQFGSMGRAIAQKLSEILKIELYDRDIVEMTAQKTGMPISTISYMEERASRYSFSKFPLGDDSSAEKRDEIFRVQKQIILDKADAGNCIIVGRCSDAILADAPNHFHVYTYAPYEKRLENCINLLGMTPDEAVRMIRDVDKARNEYHKKYAGFLPDNPLHKDLMINSSYLSFDDTAAVIADIIKRKFG